jgi:hypothetical protein
MMLTLSGVCTPCATICCSAGLLGCRWMPWWGDVTVFTKNRNRLIAGDIAAGRIKARLSTEHFSADDDRGMGQHEKLSPEERLSGYDPGDGSGEPPAPARNGERDLHGEKRSNQIHASTADPDINRRPELDPFRR